MTRAQEEHNWWDDAFELSPSELNALYDYERSEGLLWRFMDRGLAGIQKDFDLSKRDARRELVDALRLCVQKSRSQGDILQTFALNETLKKYEDPNLVTHVKEILDVIARGIKESAKQISEAARGAKNNAKGAALRFKKAVVNFFRNTARKVTALGFEGAAGVGRVFEQIANGMEQARVGVANKLDAAKQGMGDAKDRATASAQRAADHLRAEAKYAHIGLAEKIAPGHTDFDRHRAGVDKDLGERMAESDAALKASLQARQEQTEEAKERRERGARQVHAVYDSFGTGLSPGPTPSPPRKRLGQGIAQRRK